MIKKNCSKSSTFILFLNGKIESILTPWKICIDFSQGFISVRKRNWYLIGVNENIHAFRFIRSINVHQRIVGADIEIKSMGNVSKVICLPKKDVEEMKNLLIEYNQERKGGFILG